MTAKLLSTALQPVWFTYPANFLQIISQGLLDFEPWVVLDDELLSTKFEGLKGRYPDRELVPFARREDNDDVACWEKDVAGIVIIHDYASSGWERRKGFDNFWDWLRHALEETIFHNGNEE